MGQFAKKFAVAKGAERSGLYFLPDEGGTYPLVQVKQLKLKVSDNPATLGVEKFIAVCDILESKVTERPAGMQEVAWIVSDKYGADDVKRFFKALFPNVDPAEWDKEDALDPQNPVSMVGPANPAKGRLVSLACWQKETKKKTMFTVHSWSPVAEETQKKASELRAKAGLPAI